MKRNFIILSVAIALLGLAAACQEVETPKGDAGSVLLSVRTSDATKASDNTALDAEKTIRTLDVFIFNGSGLYVHLSKADMTETSGTYTKTLTDIPATAYSIVVVANGPSGISGLTTKSAVEATVVTLSNLDLTTTASSGNGFPMGGSASVSVVNGEAATCNIAISRYCSRVRLVSVGNAVPASLGGTLKVTAAYLENVYGTWNIGGQLSSLSQWVNLAGRQSGQSNSSTPSHYITAQSQVNPSDYAGYVFYAIPSASQNIAAGDPVEFNKLFYAMPSNKSEDHYGPTTESQANTGILPRLVVVGQIGAKTYYYPVTLFKSGKGLERNTAYDVRVSISGMGSDDPNKPVPSGSLSASIDVQDWDTGASYTENI